MKLGRSLQEMAAELERQSAARVDYIAPQGKVEAKVLEGEIVLDGLNGKPVGIQPHAHAQLADHLEIPKRYYDRMLAERPELLAANVNTWLHKDADTKRMIRTLDGRARAFLSPKYRPLDNFDLAQAVIPVLLENKVQIVSSELTETRMYIKGILPALSDTLPAGFQHGTGHNMVDRGTVVAAITISNSDVGAGTLRVEPGVFTTWCTNLAILMQAAMRKYHVGRSSDAVEGGYEVFRDETRAADDRAFWLKVQDVTMAAFAEDKFREAIASIKDAASTEIKSAALPEVVTATVKRLALPESTNNGILSFLARGGDLTRWGLSSAITRVAGEFPDYEGATLLERAGGEILALPARDWEAISTAA